MYNNLMKFPVDMFLLYIVLGKAQSSNRVLNTPTMIYGQGNRNNVTSPSVSVHTHRPPQGMNVYVVRKPSASLQTTVQQQNKGKV
jgi:hypothetical protein